MRLQSECQKRRRTSLLSAKCPIVFGLTGTSTICPVPLGRMTHQVLFRTMSVLNYWLSLGDKLEGETLSLREVITMEYRMQYRGNSHTCLCKLVTGLLSPFKSTMYKN